MEISSGGHSRSAKPLRVLFVSSYVPRECGIATYTEDVITAIEGHGADCRVIAMEGPEQEFSYDDRVVGVIKDDDPDSYLAAVEMINAGDYDVVALQHEFGLYGGESSMAVVRFASALRRPLVTTFHTVLQEPAPVMWRHQHLLGSQSNRIVVMNELVTGTLGEVYDIDAGKVRVLHHGSPTPPCERRACPRHLIGLRNERVLATFGLITPAKGIEHMLRALPAIIAEHPDVVYYVLGQTHPALRQVEGEAYRGMLENLAHELDLLQHVRFIDRYLLKEEIVHYLLSTDVYITPYVNMQQVTSGTLAYAVGCGCPVVSTSYLHARYLLNDGRGLLVAPGDAEALTAGVLQILGNGELQREMEMTNWAYGQRLYWPRVGEEYLQVLREAAAELHR